MHSPFAFDPQSNFIVVLAVLLPLVAGFVVGTPVTTLARPPRDRARPASLARPKPRPVPRVWQKHEAAKGETLAQVAHEVGVNETDLRKWNRRAGPVLAEGQRVSFLAPPLPAQSVGQPWNGSVVQGTRLPREGRGYLVADWRSRVWGTPETVGMVRRCLSTYRAQHRRAPPIPVGDLSGHRGGSAAPHKSHESGRDGDIGYALLHPRGAEFVRIRSGADIDPARQWTVLRCLLETQGLQWVMVHPAVIERVKTHLDKAYKRSPARRARALDLIARSVVPAGDHDSHLHFRMRCDRSDARCR